MDVRVAKLTLLCARSMHRVVRQLVDDFTRAGGCEVAATFGTVGAVQAKLDAGETADIIISSAAAVARLEEDGRLVAGSRKPIARTLVGVCAREGAAAPDISTPEGFRHTLEHANRIAFSDAAVGGSAGIYLARLFAEMGLSETIRQNGMPQQSGVEVATRVADGTADIGLTLIAEIMSVAGARVVGPLPSPLGHDAAYSAGISALSPAPEAARALIARFIDPANRGAWQAAGFVPPEAA